jgi:hypothetical protein
MTPPASHPSSCTSPSLFSRRRRPCARPWRPKLRRQDSCCCLAINALWTPPTPPNRWPPLRPAVDPGAALALTVLSTRMDAESVQRVPKRVHICFSRTLHHSALHRMHTRATPSPSMPMHRRGLLVTETVHHWTETDLAPVDLAHANVSRLHHWNQSMTPSPASRPDRRIISDESTLNRDHRRHINLEHPSPRPLCLPFAPFPHILSSVSSTLCIPRSRSS